MGFRRTVGTLQSRLCIQKRAAGPRFLTSVLHAFANPAYCRIKTPHQFISGPRKGQLYLEGMRELWSRYLVLRSFVIISISYPKRAGLKPALSTPLYPVIDLNSCPSSDLCEETVNSNKNRDHKSCLKKQGREKPDISDLQISFQVPKIMPGSMTNLKSSQVPTIFTAAAERTGCNCEEPFWQTRGRESTWHLFNCAALEPEYLPKWILWWLVDCV